MSIIVFQSHLYGIERSIYDKTKSKGISFNRTFMELKDEHGYLMIIYHLFQSHLYGIERVRQLLASAALLVSIAPLWN